MTIQFYKNSVSSANLIDESVFVEIHRQSLLFDNQFKLGSTRCVSFTLKVMKNGIGSFNKIIVRENSTNLHVLYLDSVDTSEDLFDTYVLCDSMLKFNKAYDGSTLTNNGQTSVTYLQILQDICSQAGVTCGVSSFNGSSKTTTAYDTTTPGRDYISWFSEMHGGFAYIDSSDRLQFNRFSTTVSTTIDANECSSIKIGDLHKIQRVVFDNYDMHFESGTVSDGETLYLNVNNRMITEQADVTAVYNVIKNFSFYNIKIDRCPILITLMPGQRIALSLNSVTYNTITQIDHDYNLGWQGGFDCWLDNSEQVETQVIGEAQKRRIMEVKYDAELNEFSRTLTDIADDVSANTTAISQNASAISAVASRTTANETAISNLQVTADGISADVSNLTETVDGTISSITYKYAKGTSETSQPADSAFTYDSMPAVEDGKWIWRKTVITYVSGQTSTKYEMIQGLDGQPGAPGAPGADGKDGKDGTSVTITSTSVDYAASSSGTSHPTSGWQSTVPSVSTGQYLWTRTIVNYSDGKSTTSYSVGYKGTSPTAYSLQASAYAVIRNVNSSDALSPTTITFSGYSQTGSGSWGAYAGRFKIYTTTDNSTWAAAYTSSSNQSSYTYTIPAGKTGIKCELYLAGGTSTLVDTQTIPIVDDGKNGTPGAPGADAYTVILSNESHTFAATSDGKAIAGNTQVNVIAYKGATQVAATIGTITGLPTGMTAPITSNGTTSAYFTPTVTTSMATKTGVLTVPITVDGKSFTKKFSYSLAVAGTGISSIAYYYAATTTQSQPAASAITSTTIPVLSPTNKYLWQKEVITYTTGNPTTNITLIGVYGDTGVGVQSMFPLYYMADGMLDMELQGNTKQTGKNLIDIHKAVYSNGVSVSYVGNGIRVTITTAGTYRYTALLLPNSLLGKTVTYSATATVSGNATSRLILYFLNNNYSPTSNIDGGTTGTGNRTKTTAIPSTLPSGSTYIALLLYGAVADSADVGAYATYDKVQLELGSSATDYEPFFGTIPTPDYPVPVHSVSGDNTVTVTGKNICTVNEVAGATWATDSSALLTELNNLDVGTYAISYKSKVTSVSSTFTSTTATANTGRMGWHNSYGNITVNGATITRAQALAGYVHSANKTFTITEDNKGKFTHAYLYGLGRDTATDGAPAGGLGTGTFYEIQIEKGTTATDYQPYQSQVFPITLPLENYFDINTVYADTSKFTIDGESVSGLAYSFATTYFTIPSSLIGRKLTFQAYLDVQGTTNSMAVRVNVNGSYVSGNAITNGNQGISSVTFTPTTANDYIFINYGSGNVTQTVSNIMLSIGGLNTYQPCANVLNKSTITENKLFTWATGAPATESGSWISDYIPVTNQEYVANKPLSQLFAYDANKAAKYVYSYENEWVALGSAGNSSVLTFTPPADVAYIRFSRRAANLNGLTIAQDVSTFKLEPRAKMAIELNKIGTYADYFHNDSGTWYLHKEISEYTIAASSGAYTSAGTGYYGGYYSMSSLMPNLRTLGYCTELPAIASPSGATQEGITFGAGTNNKTVYFVLNASRLTESSKAGIDAWLSANPLHITYVLQTPTEVEVTNTTLLGQLNAISQAMSYNGVTNILQENNDLPFNIVYNEQAGVAPDPPTAEVTTAPDAPDVWTINKPTFIDGYRYYNCLQIKMTNNAVSWTDVLPDTEFMALDGKIIEITRVQSQTDAHISELDDSINSIVKRTDTIEQSYVTANGLEDRLSLVKNEYETKIDQTAENINLSISEVQSTLDGVQSNLTTYFDFSQNGLIIGRRSSDPALDSDIKQQFTNDATQFIDSSGTVYGKISANEGVFGARLALGNPDVRTQRWYLTVGGSDSERLDIDRYSND